MATERLAYIYQFFLTTYFMTRLCYFFIKNCYSVLSDFNLKCKAPFIDSFRSKYPKYWHSSLKILHKFNITPVHPQFKLVDHHRNHIRSCLYTQHANLSNGAMGVRRMVTTTRKNSATPQTKSQHVSWSDKTRLLAGFPFCKHKTGGTVGVYNSP